MITRFLWLTIFFIVILLGSKSVNACTCIKGQTPIGEYEAVPIVFIGKVKSIVEDKAKTNRFGQETEIRTGLVAYLDIVESFKGTKHKEATIITGGGGGDCGFHFQVGETYMVFASALKNNSTENIVSATVWGNSNPSKKELIGDVMTTHICTLTNNLKYMKDELEIIRAFLNGTPEPRVYGNIREYVYEFDGGVSSKFVGFMPNIKVVAEGKKGKYESITDEQGTFRLQGLPVGKYNLKFLLPSTYTNLWDWEKLEYPIEIKTQKDSFEIDLATQTSGEISGTLLNASGKPVGDDVQLSLIPAEFMNEPNLAKHSRSEYTGKSGRYKFDGVKQGRYILGINIAESPARNTPYPKIYFPSGDNISSAKIIEITTGQKISNVDFKLTQELPKFIIEGLVLSADGKPMVGAEVNIYDAETPNKTVFGFDDVQTDANGRFKVTGFKNRKYLLHAYKDTDYLAGKGVQSERTEIVFNETAKPVRLVLNNDGIFPKRVK